MVLTESKRKSRKAKTVEVESRPPPVVSQFYQTKLCKHFQSGSCLYGDKCTSHPPRRLSIFISRLVFTLNRADPGSTELDQDKDVPSGGARGDMSR